MFKLMSSLFAAALSAVAQSGEPPQQPPVRVPTFANSTCPIMGKKVSMALFIDTEVGRFYVCCKPCYKKILADLPAALKSAYPRIETVANKNCPVTGEAIGEGKQAMTLQGFQFDLCCASCVDTARSSSQIVLSKLTEPQLRDVGNTTCPVTEKPVVDNAFVVIGNSIVRLAGAELAAEVEKAPAATLAKAETIASKQPKKPPHGGKPKTEDKGTEKNGDQKENGK